MSLGHKFLRLKTFFVLILVIFFKNILFDYLLKSQDVALLEGFKSAFFYTAFNVFDWLVFWFIFKDVLGNGLKTTLLAILTITFTSIPFFIQAPLIRLDYDNLLISSALYFIPFFVFIILKKSPKLIFLPIMMGIIPNINLEIANGFTGNLSFLRVFFGTGLLEQNVANGVFVDFGLAIIKTCFWTAIVILFYEINHQFFAYKSWRFYVELPIKKGFLLIVVVVFKTLIYWMVGSLLIAMVGNNSVPLFTNKIGLVLNGLGFFGFLCISSIYFRKYITLYFYQKTGHSNWLFFFFFIPFLDFAALLITLLVPFSVSKKAINYGFSKKILVGLVALVLVAYAGVCYFKNIVNIPTTEKELKIGLLIAQVLLPVFSAMGILLSVKSNVFHKVLLAILIVLVPIVSVFLVPKIELSGKIELLVNTLSIYLHSGLILFFIYPTLYFKEYLKIK
ncbi:hypothetical protein EGI26_02795 [Lacihabitans sp. CCS-44]|uniref:hypothetical protein n=1 Tax=Lacihabitans sp. CCS-44 TaxID=2487331 RepID=UPI0020CB836D|nr:hypothetical protein [Lacihabitans sp. CCS-44]MCP9754089.1 hypothetical protein [Lacihabitans sp. CCS-44]